MDGSKREHLRKAEEELAALRNRRIRDQERLTTIDRRAGELAEFLLEEGDATKTEVARILGVSAPHVSKLIERRGRVGSPQAEDDLVPLVPYYDVGRYLHQSGTNLEKVVAGFDETSVLIASGLNPDRFRDDDFLLLPYMVVTTSNGWSVGVDGVHIGYGGTGPNHAYDLMLELGFAHDVARHALETRFFVVEVDGAGKPTVTSGPASALGPSMKPGVRAPLPKIGGVGDYYRVEFDRDDLFRFRDEGTGANRAHSDGEVNGLLDWIDTLNLDAAELPAWLTTSASADGGSANGGSVEEGPGGADTRVARVFLDPSEAVRQGFVAQFHRSRRGVHGNAYRIIIEQGRLQLWLQDYLPQDPTQPLSAEAYDILAYAGLYPEDLTELTPPAKFSRYWRRVLGSPQPAYIDISATGTRKLSFVPAR